MAFVKEEWAASLMSQGLLKIKTKEDIAKITAELEDTALGVRPEYIRAFKELAELKVKRLEGRG